MQNNLNQGEMSESEGIQAIVNQAAVHVATAVVMVLRSADVGPKQLLQKVWESHKDKVDQL